MTRGDRLADLIAALDSADTNDAEEAQFELIEDFGTEAFEPLLAAAAAFSDFGRLCAIEVFHAVEDARATPLLSGWLGSENAVVREWSAIALGEFGSADAIPALRAAWAAAKASETPPNYSEPVSIRNALARHGARSEVLPDSIARLRVATDTWTWAWPAASLPLVLDELAGVKQVILSVQFWTRRPQYDANAWYGVAEAGFFVDATWDQPWSAIVTESRRQASAAVDAEVPPDTVASVGWMDQTDL